MKPKLTKAEVITAESLPHDLVYTQNQRLYYTAPTDKQFNELKEKAIEIWNEYDNAGGYRDEKLNQLPAKNFKDNFMFIVAMFDSENMRLLADKLSQDAKDAIKERMKAGDCIDGYFAFNN